ncbi:M23 family metallopeptidase [Sphingomonas sp. LT1P40]|uniref:M23 family metallopeptidase n=1 Tax=Alteristakelama amylovorans TaxID=3096166 RepID=UPI002FC8BDC8
MKPSLPIIALAIVAPVSAQMPVALELTLPAPPALVTRSDGAQIAYEVRVGNLHHQPIRLRSLEIVTADGRTLQRYEGEKLSALIGGQWVADDADRSLIPPGSRALLFVNQPVSGPLSGIRQRVAYTIGERAPVTVETPISPITAAPRPFGPPLRGGPWTAVYAPTLEFGHRRYIYAIGGTPRIPGRFAVDFFNANRDAKQQHYAADPGFGAEVLAVADGRIVAARDDFTDPDRRDPDARIDPENAAGNYVALDIGGGRTVFYEHLKRGLAVKRGDRVRRGQLIGRVGATGQVGGTHLHFHVADANSPLGAEGLPFAFDGFDQIGSYSSIDAVFASKWQATPLRRITAAIPAPNIVVRFR